MTVNLGWGGIANTNGGIGGNGRDFSGKQEAAPVQSTHPFRRRNTLIWRPALQVAMIFLGVGL